MDIQMIDHVEARRIAEDQVKHEFIGMHRNSVAVLGRAYLALTAEVEALRKVRDAALDLTKNRYCDCKRCRERLSRLEKYLAALPEGEA